MTTQPISHSSPHANAAERIATSLREKTAASETVTSEQLISSHVNRLRSALNDVPEVRPEVLARAHALATDPDWPGSTQIEHIARLLSDSPDLTEGDI